MKGVSNMQRLIGGAALSLMMLTGTAYAQFGRGGAEWTTSAGDAQRSSWVRTDPKISKEAVQKPGFQLLWKLKYSNEPKQLNALTQSALLTSYIGYRGFRSLSFTGGSGDNVYAIDTDLGRKEWEKHLSGGAAAAGTWACPGGMTANLTRPTSAAFPTGGPAGRGGRGGMAKSGVGPAGEGAVTIAEINAAAAGRGANGGGGGRAADAGRGGRAADAGRGGRGAAAPGTDIFARRASYLHAISSDGMYHSMYVSNGEEPNPPVRFLPAGANARGLIVVDGTAYVATSGGCGGAPDGVWALDMESKQVANWKSNSGSVAGAEGTAMGPDGTVYVATDGGELLSLEAKTLKPKEGYKADGGFASSPLVFQYKDQTLVAAAAKDGSVHVLDAASMGSALYKSPATPNFAPAALATWQDAAGTRWILAPSTTSVTAWKVVDANGSVSLASGWKSRDMVSPLTPMIVNGVVFAVSSGEYNGTEKLAAAQRAQRSVPAVLYALDGDTGKELWSSGKSITSFVHGGGLTGGASQLYLGTYDGTVYSFGMWIEH